MALDDNGKPNFQLLQRRMHLSDRRDIARMSLAVPVIHFVFDLLAFGEFDLRGLPLEQRKEFLARLIKGEGPLRYCEHIVGHGRDFYGAVAGAGLEGVIAKLRASPYRGRRTPDWMKIKCPQTGKFVIGGYTDPAGSRRFFGALMLGQYENDGSLRFTDKVGTGFDYAKLKHIHQLMRERSQENSPFRRPKADEPALPRAAHFCEPELVCEVRFADWTNQGGIRHPRAFLGKWSWMPTLAECASTRAREAEDFAAAARRRQALPNPAAVIQQAAASVERRRCIRTVTVTNPDKVWALWPAAGLHQG